MPANLERSAVATGLEKITFQSIPKERQYQRMFKLPYNCTHLTHQKSNAQNSPSQPSALVLLHELRTSKCTSWIQKGRGPRDQIPNICWIIEKAREFQRNIYFCFIDYTKAFECVDQNKLWKILKKIGLPDHLMYLLRNLYASQEATVKTGYGTTDWFQIGAGVCQGCILLPCLFNLYTECIMKNAVLDETQSGIKIAGRNMNKLRYAHDIPLWQKVKRN